MRRPSGLVFALAAPAALLAPAHAYGVEYQTADQAQRALFPEADAFEEKLVAVDAGLRATLEARLGGPLRAERWRVRVARRQGAAVGVVVVDDVIGKFDWITYAAALGADGAVRGVEILAYRESHGGEVRLPRWRKQFQGKTAAAPLRVGEDIANISGATLSAQHVTDGVRRIVVTVAALRQAGALP
ncbi:MAG: FMN-binding protein [Anaeromyxobacter sp.]